MTENDIVASVSNPGEENSSEDENKLPVKKVKSATRRIYKHALLDYITYSTIPETSLHYWSLRMLRGLIIKDQHHVDRQTKVTNFFSPALSPTSPASDNPELAACGDFEGLLQILRPWTKNNKFSKSSK